jgi:hypothetical protein
MALDYVLGGILNNNLQRTANLSFNSTLLYLDIVGNRIGINTSTPNVALDVIGDAHISGNVTVANITIGNIVIPSVGDISFNGAVLSNIGTPFANTDATNKQYVDQSLNKISNSNLIFSNTTISTPYTSGNIILVPTGVGQVRIAGSGRLFLDSMTVVSSSNLNVLTANSANVSGNVTANYYYGDGRNLSNLNIGNVLLSNISTDVIPSINNLYALGNAQRQWREAWVGGTLYVNSTPIQSISNVLYSNGNRVLVENNISNLSLQNLNCSNTVNSIFFVGDGGNITGIRYASIVGAYSNLNVASFMPTYLPNNVSNVRANNLNAQYLYGDGSNINNIRYSSIVGAYSNANVTSLLSSNIVSTNINTSANVNAAFFIGDGGFLTNISGGGSNYSNANVAAYLPTDSTILSINSNVANTDSNVGNLSASISILQGQVYANANVANYLPVYNGDIVADIVVANEVHTNTISTNDGILYLDPINDDSTAGLVEILGDLDVVGLATFASDIQIAGDIIPVANGVYNLGNASNQWKELWVSNSTIYIGGIPLSTSNTGTLLVDSRPVLFESSTDILNVGPVNSEGDITTTGFFVGDGSQITNLPLGNYSNANVANYLPTYSGDISATNIVTESIQVGPSFTQSFVTSSSNLNPIVLAEFDVGAYHSFTFGVTAVDSIGNNCEVMKIIAATVGGLVEYTEYGSITIGNSVARFSVTMNSSNIVLQATPDTTNTVNYSVMVNNYS